MARWMETLNIFMRSYVEAPSIVPGTEKSLSVCQVRNTKLCHASRRGFCLPLGLTYWKAELLMGNQNPEPVKTEV